MNLEKTKDTDHQESTSSLATKSLAGLALLSFLFWPKKRAAVKRAELKTSPRSVPRATNQTGQMEKV